MKFNFNDFYTIYTSIKNHTNRNSTSCYIFVLKIYAITPIDKECSLGPKLQITHGNSRGQIQINIIKFISRSAKSADCLTVFHEKPKSQQSTTKHVHILWNNFDIFSICANDNLSYHLHKCWICQSYSIEYGHVLSWQTRFPFYSIELHWYLIGRSRSICDSCHSHVDTW